ncbi:MAG: tetratricopeptide repeat protein, partial [Candidatus Bipolaricaulia bacterium]
MADSSRDPFTEFLLNHPRLGEEVFRLNEEGQEFLRQGKLKQAERKLREALSICEYAIPVLNNLALISYVKGNFRRAARRAKRVLNYHPNNIFAHCTLAMSLAELDQRDRARVFLDRALELFGDPFLPTHFEHLNKIIEALGALELDQRIYELYQAYGRDEDSEPYDYLDPIAFFRFGVATANLGRLEEAVELWKRSLKAEPDLPLSELYIAVARLIDAGKAPPLRFDYGYRSFEDLSKLDPRHPPPEIKPL